MATIAIPHGVDYVAPQPNQRPVLSRDIELHGGDVKALLDFGFAIIPRVLRL